MQSIQRQVIAATAGLILCSSVPLLCGADPTASPSSAPATQSATDPCALLGAREVAAAFDIAERAVAAPQRPAPGQCLWTAAQSGASARSVLLEVGQAETAKPGCRGLQCLRLAQTVAELIPGVRTAPPGIESAFANGEVIAGLGDRAAWKDGWLSVIRNGIAFRLLVNAVGAHSAPLGLSEALARGVLGRMPSR